MVGRILLACALIAAPAALPARDRSASHHGDLFGGGAASGPAAADGAVRLGGTGSVPLGGAGSILATRRIAQPARGETTTSAFARRGEPAPFGASARSASDGTADMPAAGAGDAFDGIDPQ